MRVYQRKGREMMNEKQTTMTKYTINSKVELQEIGIAQRIINNVIWGNSQFNPNKELDKKNREVIEEAQQLVHERD